MSINDNLQQAKLAGLNGEWLTIDRGDFDDPQNYAIQVNSHGFVAAHEGIFLMGKEKVAGDLESLMLAHSVSITIEGSEGFSLRLERLATTFLIVVKLCRVVYLHDARKSFDQRLECAFESTAYDVGLFSQRLVNLCAVND